MSLTKFTGDTNNIQSLADQPNLTASQLKAKFDKTGDDIKTYINETLTTEIDTALGTKADSSNVYTKTQVNGKTDGTVLLNNKLLGTGGLAVRNATLNDSIANYKYLDIFVSNGDSFSRKINNNNSYDLQMPITTVRTSSSSGVSTAGFHTFEITVSGTSLTVDSMRRLNINLQESTGEVTGDTSGLHQMAVTIIGYN